MSSKPTRHRNKWRIRWLDADGNRQSKSFNTHRDAERALAILKADADQIREGLKARPRPSYTFSELCDYWLEHRASRKKSSHHDESIIRRHLRPTFGHLRVQKVTLEEVDRFRRKICPDERDFSLSLQDRRKRGVVSPKTLHNVLTLLISMLNMAVELNWIGSRPNVKKPKLPKAAFSYLRTADDIQKFLLAAKKEKEGVFELYFVALYSGMRAGELLGLRWAAVDLERRLITVQHSYASTTKTDEIRHVPILDVLLPVLREWKLRCPSDTWVFPSEVGTMQLPSARVLQETLKRVRKNSEIPYYFRFHDLRHSFASHWMMVGGDLFRLQKVLGHKSSEMTQRYAHLSPHAFEQDYSLFSPLPLAGKKPISEVEAESGSNNAADQDVIHPPQFQKQTVASEDRDK